MGALRRQGPHLRAPWQSLKDYFSLLRRKIPRSDREGHSDSFRKSRKACVTRKTSTQQATSCTHAMLSSSAFGFVYKPDFVCIISILNKPVMTSRYKLSSNKAGSGAFVFKIAPICGSCRPQLSIRTPSISAGPQGDINNPRRASKVHQE